MKVKIGDKIGYISKRDYVDKKPTSFKFIVEEVKGIYVGKTKSTIKLKAFNVRLDVDEITDLETVKDLLSKNIILTSEPFICDAEIEERLTEVVAKWNEDKGATSLLDM